VFKIPLQTRIPIDATEFLFRTPRIAVGVDSRWGYARPVTGLQESAGHSPMTFPLQTGEVEMPAVKNFKATSVNEYRGNADAVADSSMAAPAA
jgi:hypothetical protein